MYFLTFGMRKVRGLQCMLSGSSGSTHDYLSLVTYIKGFSQFKASKANLLCISLNFLLSGCSVISGGLVT